MPAYIAVCLYTVLFAVYPVVYIVIFLTGFACDSAIVKRGVKLLMQSKVIPS